MIDEQGVLYINDVRVSFPHLLQKHVAQEGATPKYMADFILAPDNPGYQEIRGRFYQLAQEKWPDIADAVFQQIETGDKKQRNYGRGEEKVDKKTMQVLDGYAGNIWLMANADFPVQVFDTNGQLIPADNQMAYQNALQKIYGGCYVNVAVKPWLQDNKWGRAFRCELVGVQFLRDGEPFGVQTPDASGGFRAVPGAPQPTGSIPGQTTPPATAQAASGAPQAAPTPTASPAPLAAPLPGNAAPVPAQQPPAPQPAQQQGADPNNPDNY